LPKPRNSPQSGQVQVMALQVMPHRFSSMHSVQIWKPHRQVQQKGGVAPHTWHLYSFFLLRLRP